ncbi:MAG: tetratricopeptide repeat protein [Terriglobia bacterium]
MGALLNRWNEEIGRHSRLAGGVLFLIPFVVFKYSLAGAFVFDDIPQILQNPYLASPNYWQQVFRGAIDPFRGPATHANYYRPLQFLSYWALDRFRGLNPPTFHLFQLCLCAGTVWLLFLLGRRLLGRDLAAFTGALLWALHPLHVEVVAWIAALPDAGATFFMVAGFGLFLRAEKEGAHPLGRHALAALVYFPALFFKEVALSFPLLVIAYWVFLGAPESLSRRALRWLPYALAVAGYVAARIAALGRFSAAAQQGKISLRTIAVAVGIVGQQAKIFFWPVNLNLARTFDLSARLLSPWPWLALLAILAAFLLRKRQPVVGFLVAWWALTLLPCLDVRQVVGLPMADRFSYLPSIGPCLAIAFGALVLAPQRLARLEPTLVLAPGLLVVLGLWTVQDIRTIPNWHDDAALWTHTATAAPDSALAHMYLGIILEHQKGDLDGAAREYQTALRLNEASFNPTAGMIYECDLGLGNIALMRGLPENAVVYFQKAVHVAPGLSPAYRALGGLCFTQGDYAHAAQYFARVVKISPQDGEARFFFGTCWLKLGKPRQAVEQFHAAREMDPTYSQAYVAEAAALEAAGDKAGAARVRSETPPQ